MCCYYDEHENQAGSPEGVQSLSSPISRLPNENNRVHFPTLTAAGSISCPGSFRAIIICARTAASAGPLPLPSSKPNPCGNTAEQIEVGRAMRVVTQITPTKWGG